MEQETYQPLEYRDKTFQDLKNSLMKAYFTPMHYEPTLADWAVIKNFAEHALMQQKRLCNEQDSIYVEIKKLRKTEKKFFIKKSIKDQIRAQIDKLLSEEEYLLYWSNLLKNAEFEHERIDHD